MVTVDIREGLKTSPLKRTIGFKWLNDLMAVVKRATPPTGSLSLECCRHIDLINTSPSTKLSGRMQTRQGEKRKRQMTARPMKN